MLTSADLREALDVSATAAACRSMEELAEQLLPALAHLCRAELVVHHQIRLDTLLEVDLPWPPSALTTEGVAAFAAVQHLHPLIRHFAAVDERGAVRVSDLLPRRAWRSSPVYSASHRALGADDQLSLVLGARDGCHHALSLARRGRPFTDRDRDLAVLLRPHVAAALRRALTSGTPYRAVRVGPRPEVLVARGEVLPPARPALTAREWEVLGLLTTGLTSVQAGRRLGISGRTVDKHVEHLHAKLGATCRLDAVARGRELLRPRW
ncbi:response regulator transcription factor [uncultured Pseudokineococcus sp.]|uniref:response regulator transcription factor n=1 Tax=uncultured Pseudokineococcus sp. TaxID=1642928 RepID=UPI00262D0311|nr:helix-turn-helix transcriptional regulator [uncultured Pseudokineococcus sp.]